MKLTAISLGAIFITLKLLGRINWDWWAVLAPYWGYVLFAFGCTLLVAYNKVVQHAEEEIKEDKSKKWKERLEEVRLRNLTEVNQKTEVKKVLPTFHNPPPPPPPKPQHN